MGELLGEISEETKKGTYAVIGITVMGIFFSCFQYFMTGSIMWVIVVSIFSFEGLIGIGMIMALMYGEKLTNEGNRISSEIRHLEKVIDERTADIDYELHEINEKLKDINSSVKYK